jgi:protein-arginine kinase activator protein McsA
MVEEKNKELKPEDAAQLSEETESPPVQEAAPLPPETEMAGLRKLLDAAIEEENYEEAARIRDKIRELESS